VYPLAKRIARCPPSQHYETERGESGEHHRRIGAFEERSPLIAPM
jgi:hypothetical protein